MNEPPSQSIAYTLSIDIIPLPPTTTLKNDSYQLGGNFFSAVTTGSCSLVAGFLHATLVAFQHWTVFPPLEGVFFLLCGIVQLVIGAKFLYAPSMHLYRMSLIMNGGMAVLYILIHFLPVPFAGEPEITNALGLLVVTLEIIAVTSSMQWLLFDNSIFLKKSRIFTGLSALTVMTIGGLGYYGSAQLMALMLSNREVKHHHEDNHESLQDTEYSESDIHPISDDHHNH